MHKILHERYADVSWNAKQVPMFADILKSAINIKTPKGTNVLPEVLKLIAGYTSMPDRPADGISKKELQKSITIRSKTRGKDGFHKADTPLSRKVCDDCINVLIGASLIYTDKRIQCTKRGLIVAQHLFTESDTHPGTKHHEGRDAVL